MEEYDFILNTLKNNDQGEHMDFRRSSYKDVITATKLSDNAFDVEYNADDGDTGLYFGELTLDETFKKIIRYYEGEWDRMNRRLK